jgi:hypothetical protein
MYLTRLRALQSQTGLRPSRRIFSERKGGLRFEIFEHEMSRIIELDMGTGTRIEGRRVKDVLVREIRTDGEVRPGNTNGYGGFSYSSLVTFY